MYVHGTISTQPALKLEKWWGKLSDRSRLFVRCAVHIQHYLPAHCTSRLGQAITNHPLKPHTFLSPLPPVSVSHSLPASPFRPSVFCSRRVPNLATRRSKNAIAVRNG